MDDSDSIWKQLGQDIDGEAAYDQSGISVSLSEDGKALAVGASGNDGNGYNAGHVRVYQIDDTGSSWAQLGEDIDGESAGDESGWSVSLSADGRTVAIGSISNDDYSGHVRVFNHVASEPYDDGKEDGTAKAEAKWSGDCSDIWNFDDVISNLIREHFTVVQGDSWKEKEYKNGGEHGVKSVLEKYQLECGPEQCEDLARAAAYKIARIFCNTGLSRGKGDYEANCRAVAIMSCPGYILGKIEELIGNNTCEEKDVPPDTGELLTLQQQCEETVDYLLSRRLRLGKK